MLCKLWCIFWRYIFRLRGFIFWHFVKVLSYIHFMNKFLLVRAVYMSQASPDYLFD